jgi:hypothetical protein
MRERFDANARRAERRFDKSALRILYEDYRSFCGLAMPARISLFWEKPAFKIVIRTVECATAEGFSPESLRPILPD